MEVDMMEMLKVNTEHIKVTEKNKPDIHRMAKAFYRFLLETNRIN